MRPTQSSMQELIGRRKRAGFVGRRSELELKAVATQCKALTACIDETVNSVPESPPG